MKVSNNMESRTDSMFQGKKRAKSIYQHIAFDKDRILEE